MEIWITNNHCRESKIRILRALLETPGLLAGYSAANGGWHLKEYSSVLCELISGSEEIELFQAHKDEQFALFSVCDSRKKECDSDKQEFAKLWSHSPIIFWDGGMDGK